MESRFRAEEENLGVGNLLSRDPTLPILSLLSPSDVIDRRNPLLRTLYSSFELLCSAWSFSLFLSLPRGMLLAKSGFLPDCLTTS